ncbi:hypothetical protein JQ621_20905 [Bradyrhizobium manausense]|uniref:hypothetical protein n=1 Tax=Bradyrhizobium manausense TaxID=989370 RepID=UPI001BA8D2D2|nr:hypothetical protein [Bradyrhizobium manausense]MBR1089930.1 hypothetical protein [Bradyrhizobium manausense]
MRSRRDTSHEGTTRVVLAQEHAMPRLAASEWIFPRIDAALFLLLLVCIATLFHG